MQCPQCQGENRDTAKFCEECGSKLARACPGCGQEVSPRAKFCPECGSGLTASAPSPDLRQTDQRQARSAAPTELLGSLPAQRSAPEAERRQLTVLFCDLVDSTALAARLDPEDWREVVRAYQTTCAEVIQRFDGHIAQYLGDGLLVYFGYPRAHEDDAQRAVRTGLGMVAAIGQLNAQLRQGAGIQLAVRVGIHIGLVVVGEMGGSDRQEQLALGDTPNIAARLQGLATPDTVLLSAATRRLVEAYFTYAELGPQALKGLATPLAVSLVLGESGMQSRLDAAAPRGLTPLVGREQEVGLLLERWAHVKDGMGQVVVLSGEAGIGKSRLVQVLQEQGDREGATHLTFRCSPYHNHSALYPVIEHLERLLQFHRDDAPHDKLAKRERALGAYRLLQAEVVPLLAALLSLPHPQGYAPLNLGPQQQRQKTQEALVAWLLEEAERQPVLAVWEDLHWADPSTLELLSLVIDHAPAARLLMLLTCRPEFRPPWTTRSYFRQLTLSRLGHSQVEVMITRLTGGKALPAEVFRQIVAKTDSVPLFVEELTKAVLESGAAIEIARQHGFQGMLARGTILQGWALTAQGQGAEGVARMRQGMASYQATGAEIGAGLSVALLAEAYGRMARAGEGLDILGEPLEQAQKHEVCYHHADLYRLKGELLLANPPGHGVEAETCFRQALDVARRQQAKSLELRAAVSLARLWQQQGKRGEARQLLGDIYSWFTEGFDTVDLREARALLEALS
jgi:class 3 adenylate cyclase/tetratricopeptide (TPR) repeat protein